MLEKLFHGSYRLVDLSLPIKEGDSERVPVKIRYHSHADGAEVMTKIFEIEKEALPDGLGWAGEEVTCLTHAGTHIDAPWHYSPVSGKMAAKTIDQVPLEWCVGEGVVLDMRHKPRGALITVKDLEETLSRIDYDIKAGNIVLIMTGADRYWGTHQYADAGCGMGRESTLWLVERGVKLIGIDTWGFDRPFDAMKKAYQESNDPSQIWSAHYAGIEREYCQIEKLANLHLLPSYGFFVFAFPVKIEKASAGWVRCVAAVKKGERPHESDTEVL